MTKLKNSETKEKISRRLRKIEGQVRGVESMLDDERDCREIMQQLTAIRAAVQGVSRLFLQEYASECLLNLDEGEDNLTKRQQVLQEMITFLDKAP
jgi:CsoR family transcriptional regulator, copper-sensing transcriptional repressor